MVGTQVGGSPVTLKLSEGRNNRLALAWLSLNSVPFNAVGGTIYAFPFNSQIFAATNDAGHIYASTTWPAGLPSGLEHTWQILIDDPASIHGLTISNAVQGVTP